MKFITEKVDAIQCSECGKVKLAHHFKRKPTRKQLIAWGYTGEHTDDFLATVCQECKPVKPLKALPKRKLDELMRYNDITPVEYTEVMADRKDKCKTARTDAWVKKWQGEWDVLISGVTKAMRNATFQQRNAKESVSPHSMRTYQFYKLYREMLGELKSAMQFEKRTAKGSPPTYDWHHFIDPVDRSTFGRLWLMGTVSRRRPMVVQMGLDPDDDTPFFGLYNHKLTQKRLAYLEHEEAKRKEKNRKHKINWAAIHNPPTINDAKMQEWLKQMGAPSDEEVLRDIAERHAAEPLPDSTKTPPPLSELMDDWQ